MRNLKQKITSIATVMLLAIVLQSFVVTTPASIPAPQGTVISITNADALDGAGQWVWTHVVDDYWHWVWQWNSDRQIKVVFTGDRYSDGQTVTDPNCPIIRTAYPETGSYGLDNFYYRDGTCYIYSRESSSDPWIYQGDMQMSSSNCTMDGSKVLVFTVNVNYLSNP